MRRSLTMLLILAAAGCSKRADTPPAAEPEQAPTPRPAEKSTPGDAWTGNGARVQLESATKTEGRLRIGISVEALSADHLVNLDDFRFESATATDEKGNRLPPVITPLGTTRGVLRHGQRGAVVFTVAAPVESAAWVDVAFGPATLRVPKKK